MKLFGASELTDDRARDEHVLVHDWRVERLVALGVSRGRAHRLADCVDWREVAKLVAQGCRADLAVDIVR